MTDNFNAYRNFIALNGGLPETNKEGNLEKYYVIELMRRGKDNPSLPAANYHFKNYYIYSYHDLDIYEEEIKTLCKVLNIRAYCSVNYKLMSQVALDTLAECARRIAMNDPKKFYSIFESCSGKFIDKGNNLWIVDFDQEYDPKLYSKITEFINSMISGYIKNVVYMMPTRSGFHVITRPFNLQQFNKEYPNYFDGEIPDVKKNHLTLLYEDLL